MASKLTRNSLLRIANCGLRIGRAVVGVRFEHRRMSDRIRNPQSTFRNCLPDARLPAMSVQPIARTPAGAVRIVDQTALPDALITRDLDTVEQMVEAIRAMRVRGAPLIGIAAAMGLVAGLREQRGVPRERFLERLQALAAGLEATRPTAVNLSAALDRMRRKAAATPGDGSALWERLAAEIGRAS